MDAGPSNYCKRIWIKYWGKSVYFTISRYFPHGWEEGSWKTSSKTILKQRITLL